jgi:hypothetical protein
MIEVANQSDVVKTATIFDEKTFKIRKICFGVFIMWVVTANERVFLLINIQRENYCLKGRIYEWI